jgi:integrase
MKFDRFAISIIASLPIRKKTLANYESAFRCHIAPALGSKRIGSIKRDHIQEMLVGLPPQTAHTVLAVTKTLFREAQVHGYIKDSPALGVKPPTKIIEARKFLAFDEIEKSNFGKYTVQIKFLGAHGLRWGEAVALTAGDIRDGRIYVNKSVHGATKSQSGIRSVPQVSEFKPLPRTPRPLRKVLSPYGVTIHSLRHTYAYLLKSQGVHVSTAQKLLGHSDPRVTLAVYTAVLDTEIDDVGEILSKAVTW